MVQPRLENKAQTASGISVGKPGEVGRPGPIEGDNERNAAEAPVMKNLFLKQKGVRTYGQEVSECKKTQAQSAKEEVRLWPHILSQGVKRGD